MRKQNGCLTIGSKRKSEHIYLTHGFSQVKFGGNRGVGLLIFKAAFALPDSF